MPIITAPTPSLRAAPVLRPRMINSAASPVTAAAGDLLVVDASGGNVVINPPASPAGGDAVELVRTDTNSSNTVRWTGPVHGDTDGASLMGLFTGTRLTWTGSTWLVSATNAGAPSPQGIGAMPVETNTAFHAYATNSQPLTNGGNIGILFDNVVRSSPLVTPTVQGSGTVFTLNRSGLWVGYATVRAAAAGGEFYATWNQSDGPLHGAQGGAFGNTAATRSCPLAAWLPAGTGIFVLCFQNSGGTVSLANGASWCQVRLAWVHD